MATRTFRLDDYENRDIRESDTVLHKGNRYIPVRTSEQDGTFRLFTVTRHAFSEFYRYPGEDTLGTVYVPPHPSQTAEDIMGAHYVWEEGGFWYWAHCSPDEQVDFAADARTFSLEQFALDIAKNGIKVAEATNTVVRARVLAEQKALIKFAEAVGNHVRKTVLGETLGYYHRNEHHDHRRELTLEAIAAVTSEWAEAAKTNVAVKAEARAVASKVNGIKNALATVPIIETRAARVARLEAEKKAKETPTETPND